MSHATTVNDNAVQFNEQQHGTNRETNARRFAAECERNHDAVDHVYPGPGDSVKVYLADSAGDGGAAFHPPHGWAVSRMFVAADGDVIVSCRPEVDA